MERHPKVWGEELWIVNTPHYCGKKLLLKKGYQCSLHYHNIKDETFFVQSGLVHMETHAGNGAEVRVLTPGDSIHIRPGVAHRFSGLEDSEIIEFSTQHHEEDSYRLEPSRVCDVAQLQPENVG